MTIPLNIKPEIVWFGNFDAVANELTWSSLWIDEIKIIKYFDKPNLVTTILIPGLGASWDFGAILKGKGGNNWEIPTFVDAYDNLINSFESAGYKKEEDFFIYSYDWRKSIIDQEKDLDAFINSLTIERKIDTNQKVNIIGHSMGGLLGVRFAEHLGKDRVEKLIIAGSPFLGALDSYGVWEGGEVWGWAWYQRAVLEMLLHFNKVAGETKVEALRRMIPSIKDILPTNDYLQTHDGNITAWYEMKQINPTLPSINKNIKTIKCLIYALSGTGINTKNRILIEKRHWNDKLLGRWEDGRPIKDDPFRYTMEGDGTVLKESVLSTFTNTEVFATNHRGVISEQQVIETIFDKLGINEKISTIQNNLEQQEVLVLALRSPGKLQVCDKYGCNEQIGIYDDINKIFMKPGYHNEDLTLTVIANGETGKYELNAGLLSNNSDQWHDINAEITNPTEKDSYELNFFGDKLILQSPISSLSENVKFTSNKLEKLMPKWDRHNLLSIITNINLPASTKLKVIDELRQELKLVFDKGNTAASYQGLEVWKAIDLIVVELAENNNPSIRDHYSNQLKFMRIYQQSSNTTLSKSTNKFAAALYEEANRLITLSPQINNRYPKAAIELLNSAKSLLQIARAVSLK